MAYLSHLLQVKPEIVRKSVLRVSIRQGSGVATEGFQQTTVHEAIDLGTKVHGPSSLSNKNIIMIGRIDDPVKRYDLGIKAMSSIIKKIADCKMKIIADESKKFINLIKDLKLENSIEFTGFKKIYRNIANYY